MRARADCPGHGRSDVAVRDLTFTIDEPTERGGTNAGPTPTETAVAALIGCTNVIAHKCAAALGVDLGHLEIAAACVFDRRGVTLAQEIEIPFVSIDLDVRGDGAATDAELATVAAEVAKYCPLSKLFEAAGTRITTTWAAKTPA
jgi:putative redox protein